MSQTPRFTTAEIRRQMDVYTFDAIWLGSVLWIGGKTSEPSTPQLRPVVLQWGEIDGESLGPAPTQSKGNPGPIQQSARMRYATAPTGAVPRGPDTSSLENISAFSGFGAYRSMTSRP